MSQQRTWKQDKIVVFHQQPVAVPAACAVTVSSEGHHLDPV